jgi:uncharacterized membrane protein YraQ (UPF0718 family)
MRPGPLRQLMGAAGLVGLAPTAALLAQGALSPAAAALRALATLFVVVVVGRVIGWWLGATARGFERQAWAAEAPPNRRHDDAPQAVGGRRAGRAAPAPENA